MTIDKPVVTIFEMYGSGATEVGPAVARALGVPWLSQAYSSEDLEAAEGRGAEEETFLSRMLATLGRTAATADVGVFSGQLEMLDAEDAVRELRSQVADGELCAAAGHFVHVYVDRESRRPVPLPERLRALLDTARSPASLS